MGLGEPVYCIHIFTVNLLWKIKSISTFENAVAWGSEEQSMDLYASIYLSII